LTECERDLPEDFFDSRPGPQSKGTVSKKPLKPTYPGMEGGKGQDKDSFRDERKKVIEKGKKKAKGKMKEGTSKDKAKEWKKEGAANHISPSKKAKRTDLKIKVSLNNEPFAEFDQNSMNIFVFHDF